MCHTRLLKCFISMACLLLPVASCWAQNGSTSGDFIVEPPTLVSLCFEWRIVGDDNRNAQVDVTFRKRGDRDWRKALPLGLMAVGLGASAYGTLTAVPIPVQ